MSRDTAGRLPRTKYVPHASGDEPEHPGSLENESGCALRQRG